ncbi:MAG TPA: YIP1 family protein [Thermoanaerobaculia bacterium]|nr:YIP1 family protein [Thermoanaerobaculia bacterium]HQN07398.1 YIP1 family protein [Thermoanaerobaculia bacterium]HQP88277.1 YIP1 family protein [Thermoanaerobaculia bacterium]
MTETEPGAPAGAPESPSLEGPSAFGAIAGTFTSPAATFAGLVRRPTWWLPFLLWIAGIVVVVFVSTPKIDMERSFREMFEKRAEKTGQSISDEQIREMATRSERPPAKAVLWALPFTAATFFLVVLLLWGGARASGSDARFGQATAVWAHANLPNVVGLLVSIPLLMSLPDASETQLSVQRILKSNVGAFLSPESPAFLASIASSIDLFSLAALALLVVGMRKLPSMPPAAGAAVPIVLWALYVLGKSALAAAFLG